MFELRTELQRRTECNLLARCFHQRRHFVRAVASFTHSRGKQLHSNEEPTIFCASRGGEKKRQHHVAQPPRGDKFSGAGNQIKAAYTN